MKWKVIVEFLNSEAIEFEFDTYKKSIRFLTITIASADIVPIKTTVINTQRLKS